MAARTGLSWVSVWGLAVKVQKGVAGVYVRVGAALRGRLVRDGARVCRPLPVPVW